MTGVLIRRIGVMVSGGALAYGVFQLGQLMTAKGLDWADKFASVSSFILTAVALLLPFIGPLAGWMGFRPPITDISIAHAKEELGVALGRQWTEEDRIRRIYDPRPLPVRWAFTLEASTAMTGVPAQKIRQSKSGEFDQVHAMFAGLAAPRLVVLGSAGAGKSVMALKLAGDLLAAREPNGALPVLLSAATWDSNLDLQDWIAQQLARNHPGLEGRIKAVTGESRSLARALVADGHLLPIIDGLDELPGQLRIKAVSQINAYGSKLPLVLTCRPQEYFTTVDEGRAVARAQVIELLPLRTPEIRSYLKEAARTQATDRWEEVFQRLDTEPNGPLATALATPLMLWLARTVYEKADTAPNELANPERFQDQVTIEQHLLDALIPAVYSDTPGRTWQGSLRCTTRQAERWLMFLATHLTRMGTPDLAWWHLPRALRRAWTLGMVIWLILLAAVTYGLIAGVVLEHGVTWAPGAVAKVDFSELLLAGPLGQVIRPTAERLLRDLPDEIGIAFEITFGTLPPTEIHWGAVFASVNPLKPWRRSYATAALSRAVDACLFSII